MQLTTNQIFAGRYRLLNKIGVGGFSEVWRVADEMAEDRVMVLKVYAPERGLDEFGIKQFRREYAITLDLNHPHLLKANHFDIAGGSPYLIMPFCEGGSLYGKLEEHGPFTERALAVMLAQVSGALEYLHRKDIIHQDIKPDNVLIDSDGDYMLMDFGISSRLRSTLQKSTTTAKAMTVAYAPPEKFDGMGKVGPAGDMFSIGVMLIELLTGDLPWSGMGGAYVRPDSKPPQLPDSISPQLQALVQSCVTYEPSNRPTPTALKEAAELYLANSGWQKEHIPTDINPSNLNTRNTSIINPKPQQKEEQTNLQNLTNTTATNKKKSYVAQSIAAVSLVIVVMVVAFLIVNSNAENATTESTEESTPINNYNDFTYVSFEENGLVGFKDSASGDVLIPPKYHLAHNFTEGLAVVGLNSKWGYIDNQGNEVIPLIYDHAFHFSEGLALVRKGPFYGYIDMSGEEIIPCKYALGNAFSDGLAAVKYSMEYESSGYIDRHGKEVIQAQYQHAYDFSEGLASVSKSINGELKYGFVNKSGELQIPLIYYFAEHFQEGLAPVQLKNGRFVFINPDNEIVIEGAYTRANVFSEGLAAVQINGKYGFIDKMGNVIIKPTFDNAMMFSNGEAYVYDTKWYYIDKTGKCVKDCP
jgi:serine/threonine protein kinase